jgi:hypothetical protein
MYTDARISTALETMIRGIDAPPVPLSEILRKVRQPQPVPRYTSPYVRVALGAAAAIAVTVITLPSISPAFVQTIEERYRAALQALGGIAPPPAPKSFVAMLSSKDATLATAQSRVNFTIVPPAGLPKDIASAKIWTTPTGVYSQANRSWRVGSPAVTFFYQRANGSFSLLADRFDPRAGMPGKYMFEARDPGSDGRPVLIKHERFAWRNGDQIMTAIENEDVSASEIDAIRVAMHGVALPRRELHAPDPGTSHTLYRIDKP